METIPTEVLAYLQTQRIGVFAIELLDGSPHAAAIHVAHTEHPFAFYMQTGSGCRKSEPLLRNGSARATLVIGMDEHNMKTLQMDGIARIPQESENDAFLDVYLSKFPSKEKRAKNPEAVFIIFTPTWWRFTDWTTPEGKKVWTSN